MAGRARALRRRTGHRPPPRRTYAPRAVPQAAAAIPNRHAPGRPFTRALQVLATLALLVALGYSVRRNLPELKELREHVSGLRPEWLLLGLLGQVGFYVGVGAVLQRALRAAGGRARLSGCVRSGLLYFFLGRGLPGPSVPALLLLIRSLSAQGPTSSQGAAAASIFCLTDYLTSFALAALAAFWLAFGGVATISLLALVALLPTTWRLWTRGPVRRLWSRHAEERLTCLNRRLQRGRLGGHLEKVEVLWSRLKTDAHAHRDLFLLGAALHLSGLVTLACVFRALNLPVPWHALALADVAGNVGAVLSFLPGGLGAYEGSVALVLAGGGVAWAMALTVSLLYRVYTFWMLIPMGVWLYRHESRARRAQG